MQNQEYDATNPGQFWKYVKDGDKVYLQNVYASSMPNQQAVSLALAMCDEILGDSGAYRVHGGGFAGTIQVYVPNDMADYYKEEIEKKK